MLYYEKKFKGKGFDLVAGIDEAGRGPLAGPVVAAAVLLRQTRFKSRIDDSKKLTLIQRERAFFEIVKNSVFGVGVVNEKIVDRLNILVATQIAMEQAALRLIAKIKRLGNKQVCFIVDGNVKLDIGFPFFNIIKGDAKSKSIASASILAKVTRDRIMSVYDRAYPEYNFLKHKGYGTGLHMELLAQYGPSAIHRRSFL